MLGAYRTFGVHYYITPIVQELSKREFPLRVLVHTREKAKMFEGTPVEVVVGNFAQPETFEQTLTGIDSALLLTPSSPEQVEWERNFITTAKHAEVPHIVKFSVIGADAHASEQLLRWHGQSERILADAGIAATYLHSNFFMQNVFAFVPSIVAQGAFYVPQKDGRVSLVDTKDIAAVAATVLTEPGHEGKEYTITGAEALTYDDVATVLSTTLEKSVKYVDVPPEAAAQGLREGGVPGWYADALVELYVAASQGRFASVTHTIADITHRQPTSFTQFVHEQKAIFASPEER